MKSYFEIKDEYDFWKSQFPEGQAPLDMAEWSKAKGPGYEKGMYGEDFGQAANAFIDEMFQVTGLPEALAPAGKAVGEFIGGIFGRPEFAETGEEVARSVPRAVAETASYFIPATAPVKVPVIGSRILGAISSGLSTYGSTGSVPAGLIGAAIPATTRLGAEVGEKIVAKQIANKGLFSGKPLLEKMAVGAGSETGMFGAGLLADAAVQKTAGGDVKDLLSDPNYWFAQGLTQAAFAPLDVARIALEQKSIKTPKRNEIEIGRLMISLSEKLKDSKIETPEDLAEVVKNINETIDTIKKLNPKLEKVEPITPEKLSSKFEDFIAKGYSFDEATNRVIQGIKNIGEAAGDTKGDIETLVKVQAVENGWTKEETASILDAVKTIREAIPLKEPLNYAVLKDGLERNGPDFFVKLGMYIPKGTVFDNTKTQGAIAAVYAGMADNDPAVNKFLWLSTLTHESLHHFMRSSFGEKSQQLLDWVRNLDEEERLGLLRTMHDFIIPKEMLIGEDGQRKKVIESIEQIASKSPEETMTVMAQNLILGQHNKIGLQEFLKNSEPNVMDFAMGVYRNVGEISEFFAQQTKRASGPEQEKLKQQMLLVNEFKNQFEDLKKTYIQYIKDSERLIEAIEPTMPEMLSEKTNLFEVSAKQFKDNPEVLNLFFKQFSAYKSALPGERVGLLTKLLGNPMEKAQEYANLGLYPASKSLMLTFSIPALYRQNEAIVFDNLFKVVTGNVVKNLAQISDKDLTPSEIEIKKAIILLENNKNVNEIFSEIKRYLNLLEENLLNSGKESTGATLDDPEVQKLLNRLPIDQRNLVWRMVKETEKLQQNAIKMQLESNRIVFGATIGRSFLSSNRGQTVLQSFTRGPINADEANRIGLEIFDNTLKLKITEIPLETVFRATMRQVFSSLDKTIPSERRSRLAFRETVRLMVPEIVEELRNLYGGTKEVDTQFKIAATLALSQIGQSIFLKNRPMYSSERRFGPYMVKYERRIEGNWVSDINAFKTKEEANEFIKKFSSNADYRNFVSGESSTFKQEFPSVAQDRLFSKMMAVEEETWNTIKEEWLKSNDIDKRTALEIVDENYFPGAYALAAMEEARTIETFKKRSFKPGREFLDMWETSLAHFKNLSRSNTYRVTKALHNLQMSDPIMQNHPEVRNLLDRHINALMDPTATEWTDLKKFVFIWQLGMVPIQPIIELTQSFIRAMPEITRQTGSIKKSFEYFQDAVNDLITAPRKNNLLQIRDKKGKVDKLLTDLFAKAVRSGLLESGGSIEDTIYGDINTNGGYLRMSRPKIDLFNPKSIGQVIYDQLFDLSRSLYSLGSSTNSKLFYIMGLKLAKEKKLKDPNKIEEFANRFLGSTAVIGGKYNRIFGFDLYPKANGPVGFLLTMQNFTLAYLANIARYIKESKMDPAAKKAFIQTFGTQFFFAGMLGFPFVGAGLNLLSQFFERDLYGDIAQGINTLFEEEEKTGGFWSDIFINGPASRIFGVDLASKFNLGTTLGLNPYSGFSFEVLMGLPVNIAKQGINGLQHIVQGQPSEGVEKLLPRFAQPIFNWLSKRGKVYDNSGKLIYEPTIVENLIRATGIQPKGLADRRSFLQRVSFSNKLASQASARNIEKLANAFVSGDTESVWNQLVEWREQARKDRTFDADQKLESLVDSILEKQYPYDPLYSVPRENFRGGQTRVGVDSIPRVSELDRLRMKFALRKQLGLSVRPISQKEFLNARLVDKLIAQNPNMSHSEARSLVKKQNY